jgi:hypothetical protein
MPKPVTKSSVAPIHSSEFVLQGSSGVPKLKRGVPGGWGRLRVELVGVPNVLSTRAIPMSPRQIGSQSGIYPLASIQAVERQWIGGQKLSFHAASV